MEEQINDNTDNKNNDEMNLNMKETNVDFFNDDNNNKESNEEEVKTNLIVKEEKNNFISNNEAITTTNNNDNKNPKKIHKNNDLNLQSHNQRENDEVNIQETNNHTDNNNNKANMNSAQISQPIQTTLQQPDINDPFKVFLRIRPFLEKDKLKLNNHISYNNKRSVDPTKPPFTIDHNTIIVKDPHYSGTTIKNDKPFNFDKIYVMDYGNLEIFTTGVKPMIDNVLLGYNSTTLAYGITGTGKTHTIFGSMGGNCPSNITSTVEIDLTGNNSNNSGTLSEKGICFYAVDYLFQKIRELTDRECKVKISYLEIYNETVIDLLSNVTYTNNNSNNEDNNNDNVFTISQNQLPSKNLMIIEDSVKGVVVPDLNEFPVTCTKDMFHLLLEGNKRRTMASTNQNQFSSRSHAILQIALEQKQKVKDTKQSILLSKFLVVDLAGSEKLSDKNSKRTHEGSNINKSLLSLGNCINTLSDPSKKGCFIPYRDSKLTRLLKDSLGGNIMTVMIACIGPAAHQVDETLSTLKYASKARKIKKKISKNIKEIDVHVSQYKDIIDSLKLEVDELKEIIKAQGNRLSSETEKLLLRNKEYQDNFLSKNIEGKYLNSGNNEKTDNSNFNNNINENNNIIDPIPSNSVLTEEKVNTKENQINTQSQPIKLEIDLDANINIQELDNKIDSLNKTKTILEHKIENAITMNFLNNSNKNNKNNISINNTLLNKLTQELDYELIKVKYTYEKYLEIINDKLIENLEQNTILKYNLKELCDLNDSNKETLTMILQKKKEIVNKEMPNHLKQDLLSTNKEEELNMKMTINENEKMKQEISEALNYNLKQKRLLRNVLQKVISNSMFKAELAHCKVDKASYNLINLANTNINNNVNMNTNASSFVDNRKQNIGFIDENDINKKQETNMKDNNIKDNDTNTNINITTDNIDMCNKEKTYEDLVKENKELHNKVHLYKHYLNVMINEKENQSNLIIKLKEEVKELKNKRPEINSKNKYSGFINSNVSGVNAGNRNSNNGNSIDLIHLNKFNSNRSNYLVSNVIKSKHQETSSSKYRNKILCNNSDNNLSHNISNNLIDSNSNNMISKQSAQSTSLNAYVNHNVNTNVNTNTENKYDKIPLTDDNNILKSTKVMTGLNTNTNANNNNNITGINNISKNNSINIRISAFSKNSISNNNTYTSKHTENQKVSNEKEVQTLKNIISEVNSNVISNLDIVKKRNLFESKNINIRRFSANPMKKLNNNYYSNNYGFNGVIDLKELEKRCFSKPRNTLNSKLNSNNSNNNSGNNRKVTAYTSKTNGKTGSFNNNRLLVNRSESTTPDIISNNNNDKNSYLNKAKFSINNFNNNTNTYYKLKIKDSNKRNRNMLTADFKTESNTQKYNNLNSINNNNFDVYFKTASSINKVNINNTNINTNRKNTNNKPHFNSKSFSSNKNPHKNRLSKNHFSNINKNKLTTSNAKYTKLSNSNNNNNDNNDQNNLDNYDDNNITDFMILKKVESHNNDYIANDELDNFDSISVSNVSIKNNDLSFHSEKDLVEKLCSIKRSNKTNLNNLRSMVNASGNPTNNYNKKNPSNSKYNKYNKFSNYNNSINKNRVNLTNFSINTTTNNNVNNSNSNSYSNNFFNNYSNNHNNFNYSNYNCKTPSNNNNVDLKSKKSYTTKSSIENIFDKNLFPKSSINNNNTHKSNSLTKNLLNEASIHNNNLRYIDKILEEKTEIIHTQNNDDDNDDINIKRYNYSNKYDQINNNIYSNDKEVNAFVKGFNFKKAKDINLNKFLTPGNTNNKNSGTSSKVIQKSNYINNTDINANSDANNINDNYIKENKDSDGVINDNGSNNKYSADENVISNGNDDLLAYDIDIKNNDDLDIKDNHAGEGHNKADNGVVNGSNLESYLNYFKINTLNNNNKDSNDKEYDEGNDRVNKY